MLDYIINDISHVESLQKSVHFPKTMGKEQLCPPVALVGIVVRHEMLPRIETHHCLIHCFKYCANIVEPDMYKFFRKG